MHRGKIILLDSLASLLLGFGIAMPLGWIGLIAWFANTENRSWFISGPPPLSHMGGGPFMLMVTVFIFMVSSILVGASIAIKYYFWKQLP